MSNIKVKTVVHCCADCIFKEKCGCFLGNENYHKQPVDKENKCHEFQN